MTRLLLAAASLAPALLAPLPALALAFDDELLPACLAAAQTHGAREDCIQVAHLACLDAEREKAEDRIGSMTACTQAATAQWQVRLDRAQAALMAWVRDGYAENLPLLEAEITAFPVFRDAVCAYEARHYAHGEGGLIAAEACVMRETARQALRIESWNGGGR
ncbi:lysozyme inhibitor LprI family protein [Paracoccus sanguinis]|uniref:lysozyme inhibitor LprI family protein n=1 Tax=Paracoccus sanguinis TaxID=1545044 RepID=UPI001452659C|nr:lysozyme inhibitor LprI family protein [Paracoccus sanguinis]QJD18528.1 DUF1311 domain-containing protein [Paracoccus sanguinis]